MFTQGLDNSNAPKWDHDALNQQHTPSAPPISELDRLKMKEEEHDKLKPSNGNLCPESVPSSGSYHDRHPTYHASSLGPWHSVIAYDACVRLCLQAWAKGCMEAPMFLENECALLRSTFGVQQYLLQPKEELPVKRASEGGSKGGVPKPKKMAVEKIECGSVAETEAYDIALEVAMKVQNFNQRNLVLKDPWKWLLDEFASYYRVSDAYPKLRYLSYIMEVATPTDDCLSLVYDLLLPLVNSKKTTLSCKENKILDKIEKQLEQFLAGVFENYKSLDENSPSGMMDTGVAPSVLEHAVDLYQLTNDISSHKAQKKLSSYFQDAAKKRWKGHLTEVDEYVSGNAPVAFPTAYRKMKSLCLNLRNEIFTDIEIHNCNILPDSINLPKVTSAIYCAKLSSRVRDFLDAYRPAAPSRHVIDLVVAIADFQKDLATWKVNPVKHGVDARVLFDRYIMNWIEEKRLCLLETCKLNKVKRSGARTQPSTNPFVDEMNERLKETVNDYEVIIRRWPDYTSTLEKAVVDIEKAAIKVLYKQYAHVVARLTLKKFKLFRTTYTAPPELGELLNSMNRMLDVLGQIECQLRSWGDVAAVVHLSKVSTLMLRPKFQDYLQAVVEKLVENTILQNDTKLEKILQDSKKNVGDSEIRYRMRPLIKQLTNTMNHLHKILVTRVFIETCRGYWNRMGQDVRNFLANKKVNRSWYKGSRVVVSILDDTFASQMQQLVGNTLQEKDIEPPKSMVEVRSML